MLLALAYFYMNNQFYNTEHRSIIARMVAQGLLSCNNSLGQAPCIVNLIECVASAIMLLFVLYDLVRRLLKQFRLSLYATIQLAMILTLVFIIVNSLDSDITVFNYLTAYFYDVYFSIIVLKLGLKLIEIMRSSVNYFCLKATVFILFAIYQILLLSALIYATVEYTQQCFNLPFLIANSISFLASFIFIVLGIKHTRQQSSRLDESLSQRMQSNPIPRFKCWIIMNCIGQLMVLIQSIVFQVNNCRFSEVYQIIIKNVTVNQIFILIFVFLSFHLGIASTIYFFHLTTRPFEQQKQNLTQLRQTSPSINPHQRAIEMVYIDPEHTRDKADTQ